MKKTFFGLAGFLLGMMFIVKSSSGYISILMPTPTPQIQQQNEKMEISDLVSPATFKSDISKKRAPKKQKPSESYVNQLSALRYVMRSA